MRGETRLRKLRALLKPLAVALLLAASLVACEVEVGNFGASIGDDPDYSITMYQGQDSIGGDSVTLRDVQDRGPLVLYYFDGDCELCLAGLRALQNFYVENYAENPNRPTVLAVYVGRLTGKGDDEDARRMLSAAGATFPAGFTNDDFVIDEYELELFPVTSFYKDGDNYRATVSGALFEETLRENVKSILD